jgi:cytoskeletal protein RodZ
MSNNLPSQHPAVVLRSNYQHLRALLAIAIAVILALTIAVVVLATRNTTTISPAAHRTATATSSTASAETGAKLDHSGRNATVTHTSDRLANYPDAPQPSEGTPKRA